ncbi:hypothetical protein BGZ76_009259 [Entomortierella beljakovae]|nr:hypothetical protein BGZ76_009259 [Entomortierella beljakovae]
MSSTKSFMMAILALFFLATTVAADLLAPGNPVNCTQWASSCKAIATELYANNGTFSGANNQCTNSTTLTTISPLCNMKVNCIASFVSGVTVTTSAAPTPTGNSTNTTRPIVPGFNQVYVDLTSQLLAKYDTGKCSSANLARIATSAGSLAVIAVIASFVSNLL